MSAGSTAEAAAQESPCAAGTSERRDEPTTRDTAQPARARSRNSTRPTDLSWARLGHILTPAAIFLAIRAVGLLVLVLMSAANNTTVTSSLTAWDGRWYLGIAAGGYSDVSFGLVDAHGTREANTALAFFPGYPLLVRLVAGLPGVGLIAAAIGLSIIFGVFGAYGLLRIGERVGGSRRAGLLLVALFAAAPLAVVESMPYSEGMFCALAAWSLVGVLERRWLLAGLCATAAGLVRPTAAALVLAVCLAALVAIVRRRDGWWPWLGGLIAPLGLLGYLGWVALRTDQVNGWFALQERGWDSHFDAGAATVRFTLRALTGSREMLQLTTIGLLLGAVVLVVICLRTRMPWPLLVYGVAVLLMDIGSNGLMNSKARLLLPAFTLLVPVAVGLAKRRPSTAVACVCGAALFSTWFGAYALTVWPFAI